MTTAVELIASALRNIRVIDAHAAVPASDFETGKVKLNRLMRRWEADGTSMGWSSVDLPTDVVHIPEENELAAIYALSILLATEYGVQVTQDMASVASGMYNDLLRDVLVSKPLRANWNGAPCPDAYYGYGYDIYSDSYRR